MDWLPPSSETVICTPDTGEGQDWRFKETPHRLYALLEGTPREGQGGESRHRLWPDRKEAGRDVAWAVGRREAGLQGRQEDRSQVVDVYRYYSRTSEV